MCAALDLHILSLKRVAMGPLTLGHLAEGKFRHLGPSEVEALKQAALKAAKENKRPAPQRAPRTNLTQKPRKNPRKPKED